MVKRMTISFSDHTFENYLSEVYTNRSKYIESMFLNGCNNLLENNNESKSKYLKLLQEKNNLEEEIKRLRFENNKVKSRIDEKKEERERRVARHKGIMASGVLKND